MRKFTAEEANQLKRFRKKAIIAADDSIQFWYDPANKLAHSPVQIVIEPAADHQLDVRFFGNAKKFEDGKLVSAGCILLMNVKISYVDDDSERPPKEIAEHKKLPADATQKQIYEEARTWQKNWDAWWDWRYKNPSLKTAIDYILTKGKKISTYLGVSDEMADDQWYKTGGANRFVY